MQGQSSKGTAVVGSIEIRDGSPRLHRTCSKTQNGIGLGGTTIPRKQHAAVQKQTLETQPEKDFQRRSWRRHCQLTK